MEFFCIPKRQNWLRDPTSFLFNEYRVPFSAAKRLAPPPGCLHSVEGEDYPSTFLISLIICTEIPSLSNNTKLRYRNHSSLLIVSILSQMNPSHKTMVLWDGSLFSTGISLLMISKKVQPKSIMKETNSYEILISYQNIRHHIPSLKPQTSNKRIHYTRVQSDFLKTKFTSRSCYWTLPSRLCVSLTYPVWSCPFHSHWHDFSNGIYWMEQILGCGNAAQIKDNAARR